MTNRILRDPAFGLGLVVWVVAATLLPFQLGLTGATLLALVAYLAVAGALLATADAVLNPAFYRDWSDVGLQSVFWMISLSLPAGLCSPSAPLRPPRTTRSGTTCAAWPA